MQAPLWQFWLDFAIKALGTIATFLAVFIALFGSLLRNWIRPPELTVALVSGEGYFSRPRRRDKATGQPNGRTSSFWYFVRVDNKTRWNPVTALYVFLLSIEVQDASGNFVPKWIGHAPLRWRHEDNPQPKTIGHSAQCDLCHILKDPLQLELSPLIQGQVPDCCYTDKFKIRLTLQARGVEKDSDELRIEISWDGKWADNKTNSDATLWSDEAQSSEYSHLCEDARRKMIAPCNKSCAKPPNRPETDGVNLGEGTGLLALGKALARFLGL